MGDGGWEMGNGKWGVGDRGDGYLELYTIFMSLDIGYPGAYNCLLDAYVLCDVVP